MVSVSIVTHFSVMFSVGQIHDDIDSIGQVEFREIRRRKHLTRILEIIKDICKQILEIL